jgi:hypothetical protein
MIQAGERAADRAIERCLSGKLPESSHERRRITCHD